jgi:hypothetical protein
MDCQGMHAGGEFVRKNLINHAVALNPALAAERLCHDMDSEMGLAPRPMAGVADVPVGFVNNIEALRRKSRGQLLRDKAFYLHVLCPENRPAAARSSGAGDGKSPLSRLEGVFTKSA